MEEAEYYQNQMYAEEDEGRAMEDSRARAEAEIESENDLILYLREQIDEAVKAERERVRPYIEDSLEILSTVLGCEMIAERLEEIKQLLRYLE
jgi:hypothetical protein